MGVKISFAKEGYLNKVTVSMKGPRLSVTISCGMARLTHAIPATKTPFCLLDGPRPFLKLQRQVLDEE